MGFKEVSPSDVEYIKAKELSKGLVLEGTYIGPEENKFQPTKPNYKFETGEGVKVINTTGSLAARMDKVNPGTLVQVFYDGTSPIESGAFAGTDAHQFRVLEEDLDS